MRGKFHFTRWGVIVLALVLSLGMLGVNFAIQSGGVRAEQTKIHTSGSQPIEPGMTFGDFTVVEVETDKGKVTFLTLQYDGDEATSIKVKAGKHVLFEGGVDPNEAFSFNGTANDVELGKEVKITVNKGGGGGGGGGAWWAGIKLPKGHPIETAECSDPFTWVVSNDDGSTDNISPYGTIDPGDDGGGTGYDRWGTESSDDPSANQTAGQPCDRYDKDVAKTEAVKIDDYNIQVTLTNSYPCYYPTIFYGMINDGTRTATVESIVVDENFHPNEEDNVADDIPELTVIVGGISVGQMIDVGEEVMGNLAIHVEQVALQNHTYTIRVRIVTSLGECEPCDGQVTMLRLKYNGTESANITVMERKTGNEVFGPAIVLPGGVFEFTGTTKQGTLGPEIWIFVGDDIVAEIHTSCSQPIGPGLVVGDFEVVYGESKNGGPLCPIP